MKEANIDKTWSKEIHGSLYLMPAYAIRFGEFSFGQAGGCQIGSSSENRSRPISHMLDVMEAFGIKCSINASEIRGKREAQLDEVVIDCMRFSENSSDLIGPKISGATKTALLCSLATKKTTILNPYLKTDVKDLIRFLQLIGFQMEIHEKELFIWKDSTQNFPEELTFELTDCVSEIITFITLAVHTGACLNLKVKRTDQIKQGLRHELELLNKMGVPIHFENEEIKVQAVSKVNSINIDVTNTSIQSDHHPFFALMLTKGTSTSIIREFVWKDRFGYVDGLKKLGARLEQKGNTLLVHPSSMESGHQSLNATDTRTAAILTLGALTAKGKTVIENIQHMHRGYANLIPVICSLGGKISTKAQ